MHTKGKGAHKMAAPIDDGTKETLQNYGLTPEQQMFCIYYSRTFNATQSYLNAYGVVTRLQWLREVKV